MNGLDDSRQDYQRGSQKTEWKACLAPDVPRIVALVLQFTSVGLECGVERGIGDHPLLQ